MNPNKRTNIPPSYERAYLEPYHLYLVRPLLEPIKLEVGESVQIPLSQYQFEHIWSTALTVNPPDVLSYAEFSSHPIRKDAVLIMSSWTSDERPFKSVTITCDVWGIQRIPRRKRGQPKVKSPLPTSPFWEFLLNESLIHLENEDYHVVILLAAMAFESFLYRFLEEELSRSAGWDSERIKEHVIDTNIYPSILDKIEKLAKEELKIDYGKEVYDKWKEYVRGPRNAIMHGHDDMYDQFKRKSAMNAVIASFRFILELLESVQADKYLSLKKEELAEMINNLEAHRDSTT